MKDFQEHEGIRATTLPTSLDIPVKDAVALHIQISPSRWKRGTRFHYHNRSGSVIRVRVLIQDWLASTIDSMNYTRQSITGYDTGYFAYQ